jgi:meromycolic acid (3R)-3-hydroxyacyl-[acyl-carrier protein] dehydratase HadC
MAIKTDIRGLVYRYPDTYEVSREKIREYARSIKATDPASLDDKAAADLGYDGLVAPLTFVTIFAKLVQNEFMRSVDTGYDTMQIVQVDQKFIFHKPIVAGEVLQAQMEVQSVVEKFGADIVVTRNTCTNAAGEVVLEAYTTMMGHEGNDSVQLRWDMESGQVVRTA